MVIEDLQKARFNIEIIQNKKDEFKMSNDHTESTKLYKDCQQRLAFTNKLVNKSKNLLEMGKEFINSMLFF
jgi:hypothetical protein